MVYIKECLIMLLKKQSKTHNHKPNTSKTYNYSLFDTEEIFGGVYHLMIPFR